MTDRDPGGPDLGGPDGVTVLTLSFAGDLERCRVLCETMDRFVPESVRHVLVVPGSDVPRFAPLAGARRRIMAEEELLPWWLFKMPLPGPAWRRRLRLPRRNVYLSLRGRPVRGWIVQQILKIVASTTLETDIVLHCDSDTAFVRPLAASHLRDGGRVRLMQAKGEGDTGMHRPWHGAATRLLGLPQAGYQGADYIDAFVVWRRPVVDGLLDRIAETAGSPAVPRLAATPDFSEYILYGIHCDKVLGMEAAGHAPTGRSLCNTVWAPPATGPDAIAALPVAPDQLGLCVQSTIPLPIARYRALVEGAIAEAAAQDAARTVPA